MLSRDFLPSPASPSAAKHSSQVTRPRDSNVANAITRSAAGRMTKAIAREAWLPARRRTFARCVEMLAATAQSGVSMLVGAGCD